MNLREFHSESVTTESAQQELAWRELERRKAKADPLYLVSWMTAIDEGDGSSFSFEHVRWPLKPGEAPMRSERDMGPQTSWLWQRRAGELIVSSKRLLALKGRQIGFTWLYLGVDCAEAILNPGTTGVVYRQKETDAIDAARRWWILYQSLPASWRSHIEVLSPERSAEPGREGIKLRFPDGRISRFLPLTSSPSSGHGKTLRRALADEAAHIEYLGSIKKAVEPAAAQGVAKVGYVSTANGVSDQESGEGNRFHYDWVNAGSDVTRIFIPYNSHPDRDQHWYDTVPRQVLGFKPHEIHEQYPRHEHEAFALSQRIFFDADDITYYAANVKTPLYRMDFRDGKKLAVGSEAKIKHADDGLIRVYQEPEEGQKYAVGCDPSTGRGRDSSAAYVVNLASGAISAEFHGRLDADLLAAQLHYLGRWYRTAWLAVERNGIGEAVIVTLRHGREGRPPYPKLYRHVMSSRPSNNIAKIYGYPMNTHTRPLILNQLEKWVRERTLPWVTERLLFEMQTFIERDKDPSPAAQDGSHDDCVMAAAITLELYRLYGQHPEREKRLARKKMRKPRLAMFPWEQAA